VYSDQWFVGRDGRKLGPYSFATLRQLAERGLLQPNDLVWTEGASEWERADSVEGLFSCKVVGSTTSDDSAWANRTREVAPEHPAVEAAALGDTRRNFLMRHWRGELSLPVAYWVNGALVSGLLVVGITGGAASEFVRHLGALGTGLWLLSVITLVIGTGIWQLVGIWRSAERYPARGGSGRWATVAKAMVILGVLRLAAFSMQQIPSLQQSIKLVYGGDSTPQSAIHVVNHATEVEIAGGLSFGTTDALKTILDATPTIRTVQLNNVGGWISEGARLGELIQEHGLFTFTARECVSACLLAFMGGKERYLGSKGRLGFHEASVDGVGGEVAEEGNKQFRKLFESKGIPSEFISRAISTPASSMWYPTNPELLDGHVVTAIVDDRDYGMTGINEWRDRQKLEADFAGAPFFAALRRAEPEIYQRLLVSYIAGVQGGVSEAEMAGKIRSAVTNEILPKYLRAGPNEVLIAYWQSQIAEARELRAIKVTYCAEFFNPSSSAEASKLTSMLSKEVGAADVQSLISLLDQTSEHPAQVPPEAAVLNALKIVARRADLRVSGAVNVISDPKQSMHDDPKKLCDAALAFYESVVALPMDQGGPLLRYLAAQS